MKIKVNDNKLVLETIIYQAKNGAVFIDWGNTGIKLSKDDASSIAYDIPDFNVEDFNNHYNKLSPNN